MFLLMIFAFTFEQIATDFIKPIIFPFGCSQFFFYDFYQVRLLENNCKTSIETVGNLYKKKKLYRKTKTTTETITEGKKRLERLLNFLCLFKPRNYGYWVMAKVMFCITFDDTLVPVTAGIIYLEDIIL